MYTHLVEGVVFLHGVAQQLQKLQAVELAEVGLTVGGDGLVALLCLFLLALLNQD